MHNPPLAVGGLLGSPHESCTTNTIGVAVAKAGRVRLVGNMAHDLGKLFKALARHGEAPKAVPRSEYR